MALLPSFDKAHTDTTLNPCLPFSGLLDAVNLLIPNGTEAAKIGKFTEGVGRLANQINQVSTTIQCGYETGRLAIALYQDRKTWWSIGVVAVIRGRFRAILDVSVCALIKQIPFEQPLILGSDQPSPRPEFCVGASNPNRDGEAYTVIWLASSDVMCSDLTRRLVPNATTSAAADLTSTVQVTPQANVRAGPSTTTKLLGHAPHGTVGTVTCYAIGQTVVHKRGTSNLWDKVTIKGLDGYIADVLLDTNGDLTAESHPCPPTHIAR